jgi:hypothetical protein
VHSDALRHRNNMPASSAKVPKVREKSGLSDPPLDRRR